MRPPRATALDADVPDATIFDCALCGARFTHGGRACGRCPFGDACGVVSCPHCGYAFPRSSHLVDWLARLVGREGGRS